MIFIDDEIKKDPHKRWALPDEVFFAAGACHILTYVFLENHSSKDFKPIWIKPKEGFRGNHIFATNGHITFDYSGFNTYLEFIEGLEKGMKLHYSNWKYELIPLPKEVLVSETNAHSFEGLWLKGPKQFLHNPLPRAEKYLCKFDYPYNSSGLL